VHLIQEVPPEFPPTSRMATVSSGRPRPAITLVLGSVGGFVGAMVLASLFTHPAGAAVVQSPLGNTPANAIAAVAQPVGSTGTDGAASRWNNSGHNGGPVVTTPSPVLSTFAPLASPIPQKLGAVVGALRPALAPIGRATTSIVLPVTHGIVPALTSVLGTVAPVANPSLISGLGTAARVPPTLSSAPLSGAHSAPPSTKAAPRVPTPAPPPSPPLQGLPLVAGSSAAESGSPSLGSNSHAITPALGLLLPALMVAGVVLRRSKTPGLLFDMRYSPPG
jgi:hypothetical protein